MPPPEQTSSDSKSKPPPNFPTPLPQSTRSDILTWRFPKPFHQLTLTGRSRAAWHTSFVIPELNLLLDAGLVVGAHRPKHIFLTHGHSDHCLLTPAFLKADPPHTPPLIYCPKEMAKPLEQFLQGSQLLNKGFTGFGEGEGECKLERLGKYSITTMKPGEETELRYVKGGGQKWKATAVRCDHTVPSLGYVFSTTTRKLKKELRGLGGEEIKRLRGEGVEVTGEVEQPVFAFMGDTTAGVYEEGGEMDGWLGRGVRVVVTECSFLRGGDREHREQADKTKHTMWSDLEGVVRRWPGVVWVVMHFSLRYDEGEVVRFFEEMEDRPGNLVVWADGGAGMEGGK
ncbi:beta-lactamase-like protein [Triangularia verruculosa]|uniref:Beta-lactamase-like protein n=1 Tax=Triangularia verruculosa TaxID=2587418 RepID=A0AAN6XMD9_9PEZI|nr:beta-lactamase-like protein [Triangularia verruculosa]